MRRTTMWMFALLTFACLSAGPAHAKTSPRFGVSGGIATGDNGLDTGWIIGGYYKSRIHLGSAVLRGDFTYQSHNPDFSMWGLAGNVMLPLGRFYGLGGLGLYDPNPGDLKLGFQVGGGMYLVRTRMLFMEGRVETAGDFTSIPLVIGARF